MSATATPTANPSANPTATPTATAEKGEPAIVFSVTPRPDPPPLAAFYDAKPAWKACRDNTSFSCVTVKVPLDHAKPGGPTIGISLRRLAAAKPAKRRGSLFINPGGPGGSGTQFARDAKRFFAKDVRDSWDIIGWDPRGMGESAGFDCLTDDDLDAMYAADPTPPTESGSAQLVKAAVARLTACQRRGGALALNMGTEAVVRDLDILRSVVGDERLNYYGVSYGTLIGSLYADLFTTRVGLMVLDSAVSPDGLDDPSLTQADVDASARHWADDFDERFTAFIADCNAGQTCVLGKNVTNATRKVIGLLNRLQSRPMRTRYPQPATAHRGLGGHSHVRGPARP